MRKSRENRRLASPPTRALLRAAADGVRRLDRAAAELVSRPPDQTGLLWVFALLVSRIRADAASRAPRGRLVAVLDDIDRACSESAEVRGAVSDLTPLCESANVRLLLQAVAPGSAGEQAWVHLLEQLWALSDARARRRRGGYFTPLEVVQFIVRSADELARRELSVADGLASDSAGLTIVDPACGGGAFLLGAAQHIQTLYERAGAPLPALSRAALPQRLVGIDVVPACCAAAEILMEASLGACWSAHCGNILDETDYAGNLFAGRIPIIIGNPPYANFGRHNRGRWILEQLGAYKTGLDERKHNLDDDFIKFLRWGEYWIGQAKCGILAMITNNAYLRGLTHRQMRTSLAATFDSIYVLDLHGNSKKRERTPTGEVDENLFGIQPGVAIGVFVKRPAAERRSNCRIVHAELWGTRADKLAALAATENVAQLDAESVSLSGPCYFFKPGRSAEGDETYWGWPSLDTIFRQYVSGVQTKCDALFVGLTREEVAERMCACLADAARGEFSAALPAWLRAKLPHVAFDPERIRPYQVAPWDVRWIYYEPRLLGRARARVMAQIGPTNPALVFMRQATDPDAYEHFLATTVLASDRVFYSAHGAPFLAPLFVTEDGARVSNLSALFLAELENRLQARHRDGDACSGPAFDSHDVLGWIYAVAHSPTYRRRFLPLLGIDFPHIAWPHDYDEFRTLVPVGRRLVNIHCGMTTRASGPELPDADETTHLQDPVEPEVSRFRIGSYAVVRRWLHQRRERALAPADHQHLQRMIHAIHETRQCMDEIESLLHWPRQNP